jgi:hypothetical protein
MTWRRCSRRGLAENTLCSSIYFITEGSPKMNAHRTRLQDAYHELLSDRDAASVWRDVPDEALLRSLAETFGSVGRAVEAQRRVTPGLMASEVDWDRLILEHWTGPSPRPAGVDDNVVRHMALLPYPSWAAVGREGRSVLLHRLATMARRPRVFGGINAEHYQGILDEKQTQIEQLIERSGRKVPTAYVALFPTGSHHAEAMAVDGGILILVNSGLMNLVYRLAKIHFASASYGTGKPLIDDVQSAVALGELLTAHTVGGSSFLARELPPLDRSRLEIATKLTTLAEAFVIAHEYAHALAGHLDPSRTRVAVDTPAGRIPLYQQAQEDEFDADRLALEIIGPALRMPDSPRGEAVALSAVLLFFFVDHVVGRLRRLRDEARPTATTHPSTEERYERVRRLLADVATSRIAFDHADALAVWFSAREPHIVQLFSDAMNLAAELGIEGRH